MVDEGIVMSFSFLLTDYGNIITGFLYTLAIIGSSIPLAMLIGTLIAIASFNRKPWVNSLIRFLMSFIRNTPFLIQIYLFYFALPEVGLNFGPVFTGFFCMMLYGMVYFYENMRGALLAIPRGQWEAAYTLGMTYSMSVQKVILPQVTRYLIPVNSNLVITLIKDTALLSVISVTEITYQIQAIVSERFVPIEGFILLAILYLIINTAVSLLSSYFYKRSAITYHK